MTTSSSSILPPPAQLNVRIPDPFYDDWSELLRARNWLVDPVGTRIGVLILRFKIEGFFSEGIFTVLDHYGLPERAWLHMTYKGEGEFSMKMFDVKHREVIYPAPAVTYKFPFDLLPEEYFSSLPAELRIDEAQLNEPVNFDALRTWEVTLTSIQVTGNNMNLPYTMARDFIFMHQVTEVEIEDEGRNTFLGVVGRTSNQAFLRRGWKDFCTANNLRGEARSCLELILSIQEPSMSRF